MERKHIEALNEEYSKKQAKDVVKFVLNQFGTGNVVVASSLSIEDQVLTDIALKIDKYARIFFIDTGRHFQESYDLLDETMSAYDFAYEIYAPIGSAVEELIQKNGANLFYKSLELRKECCYVRKVEPLKRVLSSSKAWICGLRRSQSVTRERAEIFEWDINHNILKVNPLAHWEEKEVWAFIEDQRVPYNVLYDKGFRSIGCRPCSRATVEGEDLRAGRWWWEQADKKECGLHVPGYSDLDIYK